MVLEICFKILFFFKVWSADAAQAGTVTARSPASRTHGFITLLTSFCFAFKSILSKKGNK